MIAKKIKCIQCKEEYESTDELTYWDESGSGYSTKLSRCPHCGQLNIVGYKEDRGCDLNKDKRWYR